MAVDTELDISNQCYNDLPCGRQKNRYVFDDNYPFPKSQPEYL